MSSLLRKFYEKFSPETGERIHDEAGREIPDPTPVAPAIGHKSGPTLREQMRAMIAELNAEAAAAGFETLDEADDFDIPDDPEAPVTDYELDADLPSIAELKERKEKAETPPPPPPPKPKKGVRSPDQGDTGIEELSSEIQAPEAPEAGA